MGSSFDLGFASGHDAGAQRHAQRSALDMLQRKFLADQYANVAQQPLPDQTADPDGYRKALDQRAKALEMQQRVFSPEHHANLFDHIHALISGKQVGADGQPVAQPGQPAATGDSVSFTALPAGNELGISAPPPPTPQPDAAPAHPFQPHPVLSKIEQGISALGQHLKAAVQPNAPAPAPDYRMMAAVPTAEERAQQNKIAQEHALYQSRLQEFKDKLALKPKPRDSVQKAQWDAEARKRGYDGYDDPRMTAEDTEGISRTLKSATTLPAWKSVTDGDTIYAVDSHDPTKRTAIGKKSEVTETHYDSIVQQANGDMVKVPMVRYTRKGSGESIADLPADSSTPPVSSAAPKPPNALAAVNAGIQSANAASPKLNKKKPVSAAAPTNPPGVVGHKPNLMEKADVDQYKKVAEDANVKDLAYQSAKIALQNPTASSDQELIYAWVRSNVQGAGRMTQAEFRQASATGSLPLRVQSWWEKTKSGRLPPELEQMMFKDIQRSAETSKKAADDLRQKASGPISSQAPQAPGAPPTSGFDWTAHPVAN